MKRNGFTMVELMIVVAIIAIMAAVGGPSISRIFESNAKKELTSRIPVLLRTYSDDAYVKGRQYIFEVTPTKIDIKSQSLLVDTVSLTNRFNYFLYTDPNSTVRLSKDDVHTPTAITVTIPIIINEQGEVDKYYELVVKDKKDNNICNIVIRNLPAIKTVKIGVYSPNATNASGWNDRPDKGK